MPSTLGKCVIGSACVVGSFLTIATFGRYESESSRVRLSREFPEYARVLTNDDRWNICVINEGQVFRVKRDGDYVAGGVSVCEAENKIQGYLK